MTDLDEKSGTEQGEALKYRTTILPALGCLIAGTTVAQSTPLAEFFTIRTAADYARLCEYAAAKSPTRVSECAAFVSGLRLGYAANTRDERCRVAIQAAEPLVLHDLMVVSKALESSIANAFRVAAIIAAPQCRGAIPSS